MSKAAPSCWNTGFPTKCRPSSSAWPPSLSRPASMCWSRSAPMPRPMPRRRHRPFPVIFAIVPDPLGSNLVKSLARPEANVTGFSNSASDLVGKRLELLKELVPGLSRVALLVNSNSRLATSYSEGFEAAASNLGLSGSTIRWVKPEDLESVYRRDEDGRHPGHDDQSRWLGVYLPRGDREARAGQWNHPFQLVAADLRCRRLHVVWRRS